MENLQNCQLQVQQFFPTVGTSDAAYCLKRWNEAQGESLKEAIIKKHLIHLSTNREQHQFLSDFSKKFRGEKRIQILTLCKKILLQHPEKVIHVEHYKAFQEYYDYDIHTDTSVTAVEWIDVELAYINMNQTELISTPAQTVETQKSDLPVENPKLVMNQAEILEEFGWKSARTIKRRVDGKRFPATKDGGKGWFGIREQIREWALNETRSKFGTSIENRKNKRL